MISHLAVLLQNASGKAALKHHEPQAKAFSSPGMHELHLIMYNKTITHDCCLMLWLLRHQIKLKGLVLVRSPQ